MAQAGGRAGFHTITPYLIHAEVDALVAFVTQAFDAVETFRSRGEAGGNHVEVRIGDSMLMIGGRAESEAFPAMLHLYVDDADATYRRALAAGGSSLQEPSESGDGDRRAGVGDRFGNQWWISTHMAGAAN
ncbi:MAG: VOC family protein [Oscillochloris sp.]|nr:VOC family protein [Oscillochloris sp.]